MGSKALKKWKQYTRGKEMKNADIAYSDSKKYRGLLNALQESMSKGSDYENDKNTIEASNTGLIT